MVCLNLDLQTVFYISRTNKAFYSFLRDSPAQMAIWDAARETSGLPEMTNFSSVRLANLLFGNCSVRRPLSSLRKDDSLTSCLLFSSLSFPALSRLLPEPRDAGKRRRRSTISSGFAPARLVPRTCTWTPFLTETLDLPRLPHSIISSRDWANDEYRAARDYAIRSDRKQSQPFFPRPPD